MHIDATVRLLHQLARSETVAHYFCLLQKQYCHPHLGHKDEGHGAEKRGSAIFPYGQALSNNIETQHLSIKRKVIKGIIFINTHNNIIEKLTGF